MDLAQFWFQAPAGGGVVIGNSLRFRGAQYLKRTFQAGGNTRKMTLSYWVKLAQNNSSRFCFLSSGPQAAGGLACGIWGLGASASNQGKYYFDQNTIGTLNVDGAYRDPSAWYHHVISIDTTLGGNRFKVYVNGELRGQGSLGYGQNATIDWNRAQEHAMGRWYPSGSEYGQGYVAEIAFIDGTAHTPDILGEYNSDGVWVPKKASGITWGTTGFHLDFSDPADIGADRSGNGNNWTPTGFELTTTTSKDYDWVEDSPTNNYSTLNPLDSKARVYNANLSLGDTSAGSYWDAPATIGVSSGKYYVEMNARTVTDTISFGIGLSSAYYRDNAKVWAYHISYLSPGVIKRDGTGIGNTTVPGFTSGNVIGLALDLNAGSISFYKNGTLVNTTTNAGVLLGKEWCVYVNSNNGDVDFNCGNRPFKHTAPAGFEPLSTAGLPAVAVTNPSKHFTTILDSGANILTNAKATFPNGLWWIKDRANNWSHRLVDSVNGTGKARRCPDNNDTAYAAPSGNSVAWCWATGPSGADNGGGFSITSGTHGLGATPMFVISRNLSVWHKDISAGKGMVLANNGGQVAQTWTVNATTVSGPGGGPYWAWKEIPGYSAAGTYIGNANSDGPFVYVGFRPAFVMIKLISGGYGWVMKDSARKPYNPADDIMRANLSRAETPSTSSDIIDILSNGFKCTSVGSETNGNSQHYIWIAFAEHPFGGSNVSPAPAR